ncbi:fibrinogen-like protein 1 [Haliotis cracherodii]|uniref:fibrinogen-like protein 1 n=1 Tax=Haliotis cracherodii TaxID=6455 RepID=UPI0039E9E241
MSPSMIVFIFLKLFMVEIQSSFGDISHSMVAFVQYSECSAFQTPPVNTGEYQVRTKTGCARICSKDSACVAYSVSGALCRTHDEMFQTGECYSGGWKHYTIRKRCTNDGNKCKCYGGYVGDDCERLMIDCSEGVASGHYDGEEGLFFIHPTLSTEPFRVWCRMSWGGNTYIQRHTNSTDFNRSWQDYRDGFGDPAQDFWLGNDKISYIVNGRLHRLQFDLSDVTSSFRQRIYTQFQIDSGNKYSFSYASSWGSANSINNAGDCLGELQGQPFSTYDADHDDSPQNCAQEHHSGFWFKACTSCNPNGVWSETPDGKRSGIPEEMFWTPYIGSNLLSGCEMFVTAE